MRLGAGLKLGLLALPCWPVVYPVVLWLLAKAGKRRATPAVAASTELPSLTVIVPTHRERETIERRLANLGACEYPRDRFDVTVVDSGSADGTAAVVEAFAGGNEMRVRLIEERERSGKAGAINLGLRASSSDLIVITDANTSFEGDALVRIAANFADPAVGAATGYFQVTGADRAMANEEKLFWRLRNQLRVLEAEVDSTPFLSGELCCFRRCLVDRLDEDSLADDMNVALKVRRQGYRVVVDWTARFSEPRSAALGELSETKSRRAAGGIQELLRARDLLLNPRYGWFGLLILPSNLLYYLPWRLPALALMLVEAARLFAGLGRWTRVAALLATAVPGVASRRQLQMLAFNEWIFALGWWRYLTKKGLDVRWRQERSTRESAAEVSRRV